MPTITVPQVMSHQQPLYDASVRNKVAVCGRRFGKTLLGLISVVMGHGPRDRACNVHHGLCPQYPGVICGAAIWWVAPTHPMASLVWRLLKIALADCKEELSESQRRIACPGGGVVYVKSADNPDSLRGSGLDGVVIDEAAMLRTNEPWSEALRPALSDHKGWSMFLTTPKGKNWLWELWEQIPIMEDWERWQFPTTANPLIDPAEVEAARNDPGMSPLAFRQEYFAEFVAGGGLVFKEEWFRWWTATKDENVVDLHVPFEDEPKKLQIFDSMRFMTVDLAVSIKETADYTCMGVFAVDSNANIVLLDMFRGRIEGPDQLPQLWVLVNRYRPVYIAVERVQYQLAFVQAARREGLLVRELEADRDKHARAQIAAQKFQQGQIYLPAAHELRRHIETELLSFTGDEKNLGGHDDIVDVLAYAAQEVVFRFGGSFADVYGLTRCGRCETLYFNPEQSRPCPKCNYRPIVQLEQKTA